MSASVVQPTGSQNWKATSTGTASATITAAAPQNVVSGNDILVFVVNNQGTPVAVPTPSKSSGTATIGAFTADKTVDFNYTGAQHLKLVVYRAHVTASGSLTLQITNTSFSGDEIGMSCMEVNSLNGTVDGSNNGTGNNNTTSNASSGSVTPTATGYFAVSFVGDFGVGATWTVNSSTGGTYTKQTGCSVDADPNASIGVAVQASASTTSTSVTWSNGAVADVDIALIVVYQVTATASTPALVAARRSNLRYYRRPPVQNKFIPPQITLPPLIPVEIKPSRWLVAYTVRRRYAVNLVPATPQIVSVVAQSRRVNKWIPALRKQRFSGVIVPATTPITIVPYIAGRPTRWITGYLIRRGKAGIPAPPQVIPAIVPNYFRRPNWFVSMVRLVRFRTNFAPGQVANNVPLPGRQVNDHFSSQNPGTNPTKSFEAWYRQ